MLPSIGIGHNTDLILELEIVVQTRAGFISFHIADYITIGNALHNSFDEDTIAPINLFSIADHATILCHTFPPILIFSRR